MVLWQSREVWVTRQHGNLQEPILPAGRAVSTCDIKVKETSGGEQGHRVVAGAAGVTLVALAGLLLLQTRLAAVCPFWACFFPPPITDTPSTRT